MNDLYFESPESLDVSETFEDGVVLEHFTVNKSISDTLETNEMFGNPLEDSKVWSRAVSDSSDSVMCENYIIKQLTQRDVSVEEMIFTLESRNYFDSECGCTMSDIGRFSELFGLSVYSDSELSVKDICESLDNNEKVICPVSSLLMNYPELSGMPGLSADRTVEVIGIDKTDPDHAIVILNDPYGVSGGSSIDLDTFYAAWEKSSCFAAIIHKVG